MRRSGAVREPVRWLRSRPRLAIAVAVAIAVLVAPSAAYACPQCAIGRDEGPVRDLLVAGMMLAPFIAALAVGRAIAKALGERDPHARDEEGNPR